MTPTLTTAHPGDLRRPCTLGLGAHGLRRVHRADRVAGADGAAGHDGGPQSAAVHESPQDAGAGELFQPGAGFAQGGGEEADVRADGEQPVRDPVQGQAAADDVAARLAGCQMDAVIVVEGLERLERLDGDERHVAGGAATAGGGWCGGEVAVTAQSAAHDVLDGQDELHEAEGVDQPVLDQVEVGGKQGVRGAFAHPVQQAQRRQVAEEVATGLVALEDDDVRALGEDRRRRNSGRGTISSVLAAVAAASRFPP
ncbi:hypothetical protein SUDANB176_00338 [Streptomyces sp. enrichment culture]